MREIKFRAWDKINSIYVSDEYMGGFAVQNLFYGQGQKYIYQQYTGLKDKNGKEIYEGDIIGHISNYYKVYFENGAFRVGNGEFLTNGYLTSYGTGIEVKGNIFENSELLNQ